MQRPGASAEGSVRRVSDTDTWDLGEPPSFAEGFAGPDRRPGGGAGAAGLPWLHRAASDGAQREQDDHRAPGEAGLTRNPGLRRGARGAQSPDRDQDPIVYFAQ